MLNFLEFTKLLQLSEETVSLLFTTICCLKNKNGLKTTVQLFKI